MGKSRLYKVFFLVMLAAILPHTLATPISQPSRYDLTLYYAGFLEVSCRDGYLPNRLLSENISSLYVKAIYIIEANITLYLVGDVIFYNMSISRRVDSIQISPSIQLPINDLVASNETSWVSVGVFDPPILLNYDLNGTFFWDSINRTGYIENIVLFDVELIHSSIKEVKTIENTNIVVIKDVYYEPVSGIPLYYSYVYSVTSSNGSYVIRTQLNGLYSTIGFVDILKRALYEVPLENSTSVIMLRISTFKNTNYSSNVTRGVVSLDFKSPTRAFIIVEGPSFLQLDSNLKFTQVSYYGLTTYYVYNGYVEGSIYIKVKSANNPSIDNSQGRSSGPEFILPNVNIGDVFLTLLFILILVYAAYSFAGKLAGYI
ncbi:hypothetical protein ACSU1N_05060 [Thermogladius sp. 4427co]|uniref:hypothetical protein n=1 Tax=Thermogladius sp. 4427co TaxID=3450718 RepID=UPI003F797B2D